MNLIMWNAWESKGQGGKFYMNFRSLQMIAKRQIRKSFIWKRDRNRSLGRDTLRGNHIPMPTERRDSEKFTSVNLAVLGKSVILPTILVSMPGLANNLSSQEPKQVLHRALP
jgi:hypothetical protein